MNPERRRRTVEKVRGRLGHDRISERRTCRALGQPRSTQRYVAQRPDADRRLIAQMRRLVESFPHYGSQRVHQLLVGTGWPVNFKPVHRLWKQERLQVPTRQQKKRRLPGNSANGCVRHRPEYRNHVWSYDLLMDRTEDGRQLKLLVMLDEYTPECLAIEAGRSFTARQVRLTLQYLFAVRGAPRHLRSDNGPQFIAKSIRRWLDQAAVGPLSIHKASPWENGYVESFNGKLRDELLNRQLFLGLDEARYVLDGWRLEYNHRRPHSGIGRRTPAAWVATCDEMTARAYTTRRLADPPVRAANKINPIFST